MKIKDLLAQLAELDGNMEIVVDGMVVDGIATRKGRLSADKTFGQTFKPVAEHKAKDEVLVFTRWTELVDGYDYVAI